MVFAWAACSSIQLYKPTELTAQKSGFALPDLEKGRKLYVGHCANCHNLHKPSQYNPAQWTAKLELMQPKAKISNQDKQLIYNYLVSE